MSETSKTMGIGGARRETQFDDSKYIGIGEVKVIAINPTTEEYKEVLGITLKEDSKATEYIGESKDGNPTIRIDFWVQNTKTKKKDKITYFLEDKERLNKDETKKQYINNIGVCSWASDINDLPDWFTQRDYRVAYNGEEHFYNFLRTWLANLDLRAEDAVLQLEWKDLLKNKLSIIQSQIDGEYAVPFGALYTVKTVTNDDGEVKEYQTIYNKAFVPSYSIKQFRVVDYEREEVLNTLKKRAPKDLKPFERFVLDVKGEFGCKDSFILRDLKEYNASEFIVASNEVFQEVQDEDPSY